MVSVWLKLDEERRTVDRKHKNRKYKISLLTIR